MSWNPDAASQTTSTTTTTETVETTEAVEETTEAAETTETTETIETAPAVEAPVTENNNTPAPAVSFMKVDSLVLNGVKQW